MSSPTRAERKLRLFGVGLAVCICALALGLWNGLHRGHWFAVGLFADFVIGANMALNFAKEWQKRPA